MRGVVSVSGNGPVVLSKECQVSRSVDGPSSGCGKGGDTVRNLFIYRDLLLK